MTVNVLHRTMPNFIATARSKGARYDPYDRRYPQTGLPVQRHAAVFARSNLTFECRWIDAGERQKLVA